LRRPFTVQKSGYVLASAAVTAPSAGTVNFRLGFPDIQLGATSIAQTLRQGASASKTLSIRDIGSLPLSWSFSTPLNVAFTASGLWHQSSHRVDHGTTSWYYGIENVWNYSTGVATSGALTSASFKVPSGSPSLSFWQWRSTEEGTSFDRSLVEISTDNGATWFSALQITDTSATWSLQTLSLQPWVGKSVRLRFFFDSVDEVSNEFEGWYVQDITMSGVSSSWLSASSSAGTVAAGATASPNLTFNAATLAAGTYSTSLIVGSNDLQTPLITVPVTLTVTPNARPSATAKTLTTAEDTAATIVLSGTDPDGDALTFAVVAKPTHGTLSGTAPNLTYTPTANYNGTDSFTFTARDGAFTSSAAKVSITVTSVNDAPTLGVPSASPTMVAAKTTMLSALGADDGGEPSLTYAWSTTSAPASVCFSVNGTNAAKSTTATFAKSGAYAFKVTATDAGGLSTIATVSVTVAQTYTSVKVTPASVQVAVSKAYPFTVKAKDQFGYDLSAQPTFAWTVAAGGSIASSGIFTAGVTAGGPFVVTATAGGKSGSGQATVIAAGGFWTGIVNATASATSLQKSTGSAGSMDAGATSQTSIAAGDGYAEFTFPAASLRAAGLSNGNSNTSDGDIDFAFVLRSSTTGIEIRENGVLRGTTPYAATDVLRVCVESGVVVYRKNGVVIYRSTKVPTYPLLLDTALGYVGGTIGNAVLVSAPASANG
jgi:hypothetical protein